MSDLQVVGSAFSNYGVIIKGDAQGYVSDIAEKQRFEEASSDTVSIGRYVLATDIFDILWDFPAGV